MPEQIKENVGAFKWAVFAPDGLMYGLFRYEQDALRYCAKGMSVSEIEMLPHVTVNTDKSVYPAHCYVNMLAIPKGEEDV